jgi:hypothetical protein
MKGGIEDQDRRSIVSMAHHAVIEIEVVIGGRTRGNDAIDTIAMTDHARKTVTIGLVETMGTAQENEKIGINVRKDPAQAISIVGMDLSVTEITQETVQDHPNRDEIRQ